MNSSSSVRSYQPRDDELTYVSEGGIDLCAIPMDQPSLCIPRVFHKITRQQVGDVISDLNLGDIDHIDMVVKPGDTHGRVFIHFRQWYVNPTATKARGRVVDGKEIKVIYQDPWFWKISANRARVHHKPYPPVAAVSRPILDLNDRHVPRRPAAAPIAANHRHKGNGRQLVERETDMRERNRRSRAPSREPSPERQQQMSEDEIHQQLKAAEKEALATKLVVDTQPEPVDTKPVDATPVDEEEDAFANTSASVSANVEFTEVHAKMDYGNVPPIKRAKKVIIKVSGDSAVPKPRGRPAKKVAAVVNSVDL